MLRSPALLQGRSITMISLAGHHQREARHRAGNDATMNMMRTAILLAALTAIFMGVGYLVGGPGGMMIAFVMAAGMNLFSYWNGDRMVLSMYGAREVDERSAPQYYGIVKSLAARAGLPMPRVFIIDSDQPNAFATGRNPQNAAVAASSPLA